MLRPRSLRCTVLVVGLAASCLAGCGSSSMATDDGMPSVGPDRIPDEAANPTLRNDCFAIAGKVLAANVGDSTANGPVSRFLDRSDEAQWTPMIGETGESSSVSGSISQSWSAPGLRDPNAACPALTSMFSTSGAMDGDERVAFAMRIEHRVLDLAYPPNLASAPPVGKAIPVKVASTLHIDFQRPWHRADGTIDPDMTFTRDEEAQAWPIEMSCKTPFTATPFLEKHNTVPAGGAPFCTSHDGINECFAYSFDYVGDDCTFVVQNATVRTLAGDKVKLSFAGALEREKREGREGYSLRVTNWEFQ